MAGQAYQETHLRRWAWFFLLSAMHVGLAAWTFIGPPIVGKWAAGVFTMIDQFKKGGGTVLSVAPLTGLAVADMHHLYLQHSSGSH